MSSSDHAALVGVVRACWQAWETLSQLCRPCPLALQASGTPLTHCSYYEGLLNDAGEPLSQLCRPCPLTLQASGTLITHCSYYEGLLTDAGRLTACIEGLDREYAAILSKQVRRGLYSL